jgi:hypothetical protein
MLVFSLLIFCCQWLVAQTISIDGEYRINPVYSRGFREPMYAGDEAGLFTMQRTRLILRYSKPQDMETEFIFQDRRFWGDQDDRADVANLSVFRAWVEKYISPQFSVRLGRQGFVYDEQHLLGDPNWVGTRAHDAALFKYENNKFKAHIGLAYNANGQELKREVYDYNMYKTLQFLWVEKQFNKHLFTFTLINRGMEKGDTTSAFTQTFGPYAKITLSDKLMFKGLYYYQIGETTEGLDVNASFYSAQLIYEPNEVVDFTLGVDAGSGTNTHMQSDPTNTKSHSFDRHYGLLHGHFGYIDYFYVTNPTLYGVHDYYLKTKVDVTKKFSMEDHLHSFTTSARVYDALNDRPMSHALGIENDILLNYKFSSNFKASFGHSIMFGTETLDQVFGGKAGQENQVFYAVITATPNFFKSKSEQ